MRLGTEKPDQVDELKYQVFLVSEGEKKEAELKQMHAEGTRFIGGLVVFWRNKAMTNGAKKEILESLVVKIVT